MTRRSSSYRSIATLAVALTVLAACSEFASPPTDSSEGAPTMATTMPTTTKVGDTTITTFVYDYRVGTSQDFDKHKLVLPALSVCDPKSSYGPNEWDKSCTAAKTNLTITARHWLDANGRAQIHFDQHLRFVPTTDDNRFVKLFLHDKDATDATLAAELRIDWVPSVGATPVDEYAADPTLRTQVSEKAGKVWRRIKHFSGYMVASGREAESTAPAEGTE